MHPMGPWGPLYRRTSEINRNETTESNRTDRPLSPIEKILTPISPITLTKPQSPLGHTNPPGTLLQLGSIGPLGLMI